MTKIKQNPVKETDQKTEKDQEHFLILYNDDFNSFDYVIEALIDICDHSLEQATQCTMLAHYKGKCDIKKGNYNTLASMHKSLNQRKLTTQIN